MALLADNPVLRRSLDTAIGKLVAHRLTIGHNHERIMRDILVTAARTATRMAPDREIFQESIVAYIKIAIEKELAARGR